MPITYTPAFTILFIESMEFPAMTINDGHAWQGHVITSNPLTAQGMEHAILTECLTDDSTFEYAE